MLIELDEGELRLIRETLEYYEKAVNEWQAPMPDSDRAADRARRKAQIKQSSSIRYRITAAIKNSKR
jgi:hypothetical protein